MMLHPEIHRAMQVQRVADLRGAAASHRRRTRRSPRGGALALAGARQRVTALLRRSRPAPAFRAQ